MKQEKEVNDDLDINLPADADDLSKHAPLLFALKNKEEGFVVPALYFEELSELVVSKTAIPEDGGLVVPENYFEESTERIIALSSFDFAQYDKTQTEEFIVPENYFEELPSIVEAKTSIPTEDGLLLPEKYFEELGANIESQIALESVLSKAEGEVPEGYFSELENKLHVHIALDNVKQDEGFVVPEGYFENLTEKVLASSSFDSLPTGQAGAQYDNAINDDEVPHGYFDSLADKVVARIESEEKTEERGRVIVLSQWKKYVTITAVAASVALLVVFAWTFAGNDDGGNGSMFYAFKPKNLVPDNFVRENPQPVIDTTNSSVKSVAPEGIAYELPKKPKGVKLPLQNEVIMNDDEIIAQSDLMDEALVMEFVSESGVIEETEEVLDPAMMEYLMNDNTSLDVFVPAE
jgi:hypothetical protein